MPMIGNQITQGAFLELDALSASATANYTLKLNSANYSPESVNNLLVSINGVIQGSSTMSLNGAVLTVGATLSASDTIDFVRVFGNVGTITTPTDGSVTANKIGTGAVTTAKIADDAVVLTSKVSGVLPVANSQANTPAFRAIRTSALAQTQNQQTLMLYNAEQYDTHNAYNVSNGRFTPGVAGKYFVNMSIGMDGLGASNTLQLVLKVNGADWAVGYTVGGAGFQLASVITLDADDYVTAHFKTNCASSVTITGQAPKTHFEAFKLIGA